MRKTFCERHEHISWAQEVFLKVSFEVIIDKVSRLFRYGRKERHETILQLLDPIELNNGLAHYSLFDKAFLFEYSFHNLANILKKIRPTYFLE